MKKTLNRLGKYYEHRGSYELAVRYYRASRNIRETATDNFNIGNVLYRSGSYGEAVEFLRKAVEGRDDYALWTTRYVNSAKRAQKLEEELRHFSQPSSIRAELLKVCGAELESRGQFQEGFARYAEADSFESTEETSTALYRLMPAKLPAWQKVKIHSKAFDYKQRDFKWLTTHGDLFSNAFDYRSAGDFYLRASHTSITAAWTPYKAGAAFETVDDPRSTEAYALAIQRDKKFDARRLGLGALHEHARRHHRAAESFDRDAKVQRDVETRIEQLVRGGLHYQADLDYSNSTRLLSEAHRLRPTEVRILKELGRTCDLACNFAEAAGWYTKAIACGAKEDRDYIIQRTVNALYRIGNYREGVEFFLEHTVNDSTYGFIDPYYSYAVRNVPSTQRQIADAETPETVFTSGSPLDTKACLQWAKIALAEGNTVAAIRLLERAIDIGPAVSPLETVWLLAKTYRSVGDFESGCKTLLHLTCQVEAVPALAEQIKSKNDIERANYRNWRDNYPLRPQIIVYESNLGMSVDCNPLEIYRNIRAKYGSKYLHVWSVLGQPSIPEDLLGDPNTIIISKDSDSYVKMLATAKYLVNNSTFPTYFIRRDDQQYLMTWHGTPLKTLGKYQREIMTHANMARNYLQCSIAIFPNEHTRSTLLDGCDVTSLLTAKVEITGYPRIDPLINRISGTAGKKTVLYAPTWRPDELMDSQVETIRRMVKMIVEAGYRAVVRAHHYVEEIARKLDPTLPFAERTVPTNDLLPNADILITDYSSIYFDFAVSGRPIIFHVADWQEYDNSRGLLFPIETLPGTVCTDLAEVGASLQQPDSLPLPSDDFIREFNPCEDGFATERCVDLLLGPVEDCQASTQQKRLLFRQSFIPNGMASSFVNLVNSLPTADFDISVVTDANSLKTDVARQSILGRLVDDIHVLGRVGQIVRSALELHASRAIQQDPKFVSAQIRRAELDSFEIDAQRVTGHAKFDAAIEFDGYSEFMAKLVIGHSKRSSRTAIYLHNDIQGEIELRMPELQNVADIYSHFDHAVAVSETLADINRLNLSASLGDPERLTYARNVIEPERLKAAALDERDSDIESFLASKTAYVVYVGRMSPEKNVRQLIAIFSRVEKIRPDIGLLLVGDGPQREALEYYAREELLAGSYYFAGQRENPYPYIAKASALVMTSLHEGQPMVILESLTLKTPVVALKIPPLLEFDKMEGVHLCDSSSEEFETLVIEMCDNSTTVNFNADEYVVDCLSDFYRVFEFHMDDVDGHLGVHRSENAQSD